MNELETLTRAPAEGDHAALRAACQPGAALCTIVGIEGSFSRRHGAQLAILPDGSAVGSLADGCLERQLASELRRLTQPEIRRYGAGSGLIDFRLPCGGGLDILLDPAPDCAKCRQVAARLDKRLPATLSLPGVSPMPHKIFIPTLQIRAFGEGPELEAFERLAGAMRIPCDIRTTSDLALNRPSGLPSPDRWTAVVLLFHDHEWELALLQEALEGEAFYIGAQGGENARIRRSMELLARGIDEQDVARVRSPLGLIPSCKEPDVLALSVLSEIVGEYERLREPA